MQTLNTLRTGFGALLIMISALATGCATGASGTRVRLVTVHVASSRTQFKAVKFGHENLVGPKTKTGLPLVRPSGSRVIASLKPASPVTAPVISPKREVFAAKEAEDGEDFVSYIGRFEVKDGKVSAFIGENSLANSKVGLYREVGFREVATPNGTRLVGSTRELARLADKFTDHAFVAEEGNMLRFAAVALSQTAADGTITVLVGRGTGVSLVEAQKMGFQRDPRSRDSHGVAMMKAKASDLLQALKSKRRA